ncbi:MAG: tyrosine-type recombinase/integrase [Sphingomonas sp.]|nr:tyrosine-type recombinase/integrase [Sphingomonas sp.]
MPRPRPPYIRQERTRHGRLIWTFRRGAEYVRLPDVFGSTEFWTSYNAALEGKKAPKPTLGRSGTLEWLVRRYKQSGHFASLAPTSKINRDYIMQAVCKEAGHVPFVKVTRLKIQEAMDRRAATPHAANNFLVAMSVLFKWAVDNEMVEKNPCEGVSPRKDKIKGFHTWSIEEVEQFRAKHPVGSKPRLALDLLLFTGLRRGDVRIVGKQHVREGVIALRTGKTNAQVHLPIFPKLQASLDNTATGNLVFLTNAKGEPFANAQAFGMWFIRQCNAAGLPAGCTAHGLRKAGATIAANNGATAHELMAMFGWSRISMAEVYTKQADRARLARGASERIANNSSSHLQIGAAAAAKK